MTARAAGILFLTPDKKALFLRRTASAPDCPGCWDLPGGGQEGEETAEETALREAREEVGKIPGGELLLHTRQIGSAPPGAVGHGAPPILPVSDGAPEAPVNFPLPDVDFSTFVQRVDEEFEPKISDEHDGFAWAPLSGPPEPLHPGVRIAIDRFGMNELDVARAISTGRLPSPQRYENVWLFAIRITGTHVAFRPKVEEFVVRQAENYLTDEFLQRCNGLPVIFKHPKAALLDSKEFSDRIVGTVFLPYIAGDEVWAVAKIYVDDVALMMKAGGLSTSPGVNFADFSVNMKLRLEDGSKVLVEGDPSLLDHVAICELGVWDKGGEATGIRSESREDSAMADEDKKKADEDKKRDDARKDDKEEKSEKKDDSAKKDEDKKEEKEDEKSEKKADRKDADEDKKDRDDSSETLKSIADSLASMHKRMDAFEEEKKADAAKADSKKDAKKDDDEAEKPMADKKDDAEEKSKADSADIRAQIKRVESLIPKSHTESDWASVAAAQGRADAVYADFGRRAPIPVSGEPAMAYERRALADLKQHSKTWKGADLNAFADDATFSIVRDGIYKEAREVAASPASIPAGELRMKTSRADGHTHNEFIGQPRDWMDQIAGATRQYATEIKVPRVSA